MFRWREENLQGRWKSAQLRVHCIQEIFSFLLLTSCLWEHAPFSLSALIRLLTADNTETNSAGCTLILSTSTNARKFTHAHSHRSNCRDEILSFTEMFLFQNTLCGWVTFFFFIETPAIMCPYTSLLILICHIYTSGLNIVSTRACTYTHPHLNQCHYCNDPGL